MTKFARRSMLRHASLLLLGVISLHQLRYLVGYEAHSGEALARQGHGYLAEALPALVGVAIAVIGATLAVALARGVVTRSPSVSSERHRVVWLVLLLLAIYSAQELIEGVLFAGHPAGLAALFAGNGWVAVPIAIVVAGFVSLVGAKLDRVETVIQFLERAELPRPPARLAHASLLVRISPRPLAFGIARRPPPAFDSN